MNDSKYLEWHENGQIKTTGLYKDEEKEGSWIEWNELGIEISKEFYLKGKLEKLK